MTVKVELQALAKEPSVTQRTGGWVGPITCPDSFREEEISIVHARNRTTIFRSPVNSLITTLTELLHFLKYAQKQH